MNPLEKVLLFVAAPAVLVFALIEAVVLSRRQRDDWRAFGVLGAGTPTAELRARQRHT